MVMQSYPDSPIAIWRKHILYDLLFQDSVGSLTLELKLPLLLEDPTLGIDHV